jgi:hypothetical protein
MLKLAGLFGLLTALTACSSGGETEWPADCSALCDALVTDCAYEAYPTMNSCLQGCTYDIELGKDIGGQRSCVESANCNLFTIVECQHAAE